MRFSRFLLPLLALALLLLFASGPVRAATPDEQDAINAAEQWLVPVDAGKAADAWAMASASFKSTVGREVWRSGLADLRKPFGRVESRKAGNLAHLGDAPADKDRPRGSTVGSRITILFETHFAGDKTVAEEVMLEREKDGVWRVAGYFIRG